jgi:hypothetical protein
MRMVLVLLPVAIAGGFVLGRATMLEPAAAAQATHVYTGHLHDLFRVPGAAVRCEVAAETDAVNLSCEHVPYARARYEVVFYSDDILVYRLGRPDKPVWTARGKP